VEIPDHIDARCRQGGLLAAAAERVGLDAPVPPCLTWQVKDRLRHAGYIHRRAARHIIECPEAVIDGPSEEEILRTGATDEMSCSADSAGHARLVETLAEADPALAFASTSIVDVAVL
jgi:hypothetical protein